MFPLLDVGGPFLIVFLAGGVVAGVLATAGLVLGGWWLARRMRRSDQQAEPRDPELSP
jgi:hypothetical protein